MINDTTNISAMPTETINTGLSALDTVKEAIVSLFGFLQPIIIAANQFVDTIIPEEYKWVKIVIGLFVAFKIGSMFVDFIATIVPFVWENVQTWKWVTTIILYIILYSLGWK